MATATESAPLLPSAAAGHDEHVSGPNTPCVDAKRVTLLVASIVFITTMGSGLTTIPTLRVLEDILCRRLHTDSHSSLDDIDESLCKGDDVQKQLARLLGIQSSLEAVPSLLLAFPYGLLADRIGRRPVLVLSLVGMVFGMSWMMLAMRLAALDGLPLWTIWTSTIWQVIGGGGSVMISMIYAMVADVQAAADRADAFYTCIVGSLVAELLSVPVSTKLMQTSPWIPLLGGLLLVILGGFCVAFIPETFVKGPAPDGDSNDSGGYLTTLKTHLSHSTNEFKDSLALLSSGSIVALLFTFLIHGLVGRASGFAVQYLSKRFHWSLAQAGVLITVRNVVNIALLLVILPACSRLLLSSSSSWVSVVGRAPEKKDLILARASGLLLVFGALLMAGPSVPVVCAGLMVFTLGGGSSALCRSLITALVDAHHTARLYALISVVDGGGSLAAGPLVAWLFGQGLGLGGTWVGLPYLGVAFMCSLAVVGVFAVGRSFTGPSTDIPADDTVTAREEPH